MLVKTRQLNDMTQLGSSWKATAGVVVARIEVFMGVGGWLRIRAIQVPWRPASWWSLFDLQGQPEVSCQPVVHPKFATVLRPL